jgi:sugar phosphate isomerase/epimerase
MRFGICTPVESAAAVKAAGWEFVEESIQGLFQGLLPDPEWTGLTRFQSSALPVPAANMLVPGNLKITGPEVDSHKLKHYMTHVLQRANKTNTRTLVFGSGGARNVPDGFDRNRAKQQIIDFVKTLSPIAQANNITVVAEPLNRKECNIINSVAEAMEYVKAVNHPNFQCLVDSYHLWLEDEPVENVQKNIAFIKHVHLADKDGRVAPGLSGTSDYRPLFKILKAANYSGLVSVEALNFDIAKDGPRVLEFVKKQWNEV